MPIIITKTKTRRHQRTAISKIMLNISSEVSRNIMLTAIYVGEVVTANPMATAKTFKVKPVICVYQ